MTPRPAAGEAERGDRGGAGPPHATPRSSGRHDGDRRPGIGRAADPQPAPQRLDAVGEPAQPGAEPRVSAADAVVGDRDVKNRAVALHVAAHTRRVRVLGDVGERLGAHEVGRRLDAGGKPSVGRGDDHGHRRVPAERRQRRREAVVGEYARMDAAAELAQLRARLLELAVEEVEQLELLDGGAGADCPYGHGDVREASLDAVVQPAGNASALLVARGHDALARGTELGEPSRALGTESVVGEHQARRLANSDDELLVVQQRLVVHEDGDALAVALDGGRRAPRPGPRQREGVAVADRCTGRRRAASSRWSGSGRQGRGRERAARCPTAGPARARPRGPSRCRARAARAPRPRRATGQRPQDPPRRRRAPCACTPR